MYFDTSHYLLALAVGLPLVALLWLFAYRCRSRGWYWRLGLSALLATAIAPTAIILWRHGHVGHTRVIVYPAVLRVVGDLRILGDFIGLLFQGSILHGYGTDLFYGIMPIMLTTAIVFGFWTYFRSRRIDAHAA
jgi:hypothetical protein